jgi:uncharacterized protein with GYD domain
MATFVMLTRVSPEAVRNFSDYQLLERQVADKLKEQVPEAKWLGSYAVLGPYDYLDIFEAPNEVAATKVALIVRSFGHATTETWVVTPWDRFVDVTRELK